MKTERIVVKCEIPFLIRVDDPETDEFQFFSIPAEGYTARIGFRMAPGEGKGNVTIAGSSEEDRLGHMSTTHVQLRLDGEFVDTIPEEVHTLPDSAVFRMSSGGNDETTYIAEEATNLINKFLDVYKVETDGYWMRKLLPHDIFDFIIIRFDEDGGESQQHHKHTASAMTGMGSTVSDGSINTIQSRLANNEIPGIFPRLQLRVRDQLSLREYGLAVVNSQRLLETWLKEAFVSLLVEAEGYTKSEAEDTARHSDGEYKSLHDIWSMYRSYLNFDLQSTSEFQQWNDISYELRKDIIHEGYEPSEEEAMDAVQLNNNLIMRVKSEFEKDLTENLCAVKELPDDVIGRTALGDSSRD